MNVTIDEEDEQEIEFTVEGISTAFANALRRTMIGGVPTLAIEDVHVSHNNSGLFDEILAHRLGLLPWSFDPEHMTFQDACDCEEGCPDCTVSMALQKEGPHSVTAGDITVPDDDVESTNPDTLLVDLNEESALELEAEAVLGLGRDHAKWQAANAAYQYNEDDDAYHFTVESVSGLDPRTIVLRAVDTLTEDVDAFTDAVDA